jgi:hypothetical protein
MQYSIHSPSAFIQAHWRRLLPAWTKPAASILLVLQPAEINLLQPCQQVHEEKQQLRQQFLEFANTIAQTLKQSGHLVEIFDPRSGLPMLSPAGTLHLDDVAVVQNCLGYPVVAAGGCATILHPEWGSAVYPSTLLCSASPRTLQALLENLNRQHCVTAPYATVNSHFSISHRP